VGAVSADRLKSVLGPATVAARSDGAKARIRTVSDTAAAPTGTPGSGSASGRDLIERSVRIIVEEPRTRSFGTGTIIRSVSGETLILTCAHLFEGSSRDVKTTVEFLGGETRLSGELVARDREADVSLVRVTPDRVFAAARVASRQFMVAPGARTMSVGCDNGQQPSVREMRITAVNRYLGAPTIECTGQPAQGRSGGGLFNEAGELIGVCSAAEPSEKRGIYGGLAAVHKLLDQQGLTNLYEAESPNDSLAQATVTKSKPGSSRLVLPSPETLGLKVNEDLPLPANVGDAEVVCMIRSTADPEAPLRMFVLNRASSALLSILEKEEAAQGSRSTTSMRLPNRPELRPVLTQPSSGLAVAEPKRLDSSAWRAAGTENSSSGPHARKESRGVVEEAALWERNWSPGASSASSLGNR
jgi:hypothetical protein